MPRLLFIFVLGIGFTASSGTVKDSIGDPPVAYTNENNVIIQPNLQAVRISGQVTSKEDGEGLPGVNVLIKGTALGTVTDIDGNYKIDVSDVNTVLVFSSIGFITEEVLVGTRTVIDVMMVPDIKALEEIVVVGYGTQKKVSLTNAVSTVTNEQIISRTTSNVQQALQGYVSGLTVVDQGGSPGSPNITMRVRGVTTLNDKNDPLVIIDGIEQDLTDINPNDIESISLLKDASSTAIYGSRGANGVLLITTKRGSGEDGQISVSYNSYYAFQSANNVPEHMEVEAYMRLQNLAFTNSNLTPRYTEDQIQTHVNSTDRFTYPLPQTMHDAVLSTALQHSHNLSFRAGSKNVKSAASIRYQEQDGIIANSDAEISEIRLNNDFIISPKIKASADFHYRNKQYREPYNSDGEVFTHLLLGSQWAVPRYPDGSYGVSSLGNNPLLFAEAQGSNNFASDYIFGNIKGEWEIVKNLILSVQYGKRADYLSQHRYQNVYNIVDPNTGGRQVNLINRLDETRNKYSEWTLNNLINYSFNVNDHNFSVLGGYSEIYHRNSDLAAYRQEFYNNDIQSLDAGVNDNTKNNSGRDYEWSLRSYFGRLNYNFKDKYLLEFSSRYDGSSRFTGDNLYGFFPSLSAGWRVSEEGFWGGMEEAVNDFKLRASWGQTGNQQIDLYSFYENLTIQGYVINDSFAPGYVQTDLANSDISWETTTQLDLGFDAEFLNNKFSLSFDYYHKRTDDILLLLPVPSVLGLNASFQNAGRVDNKGIEILLKSYHNINEIKLDVNLQLTYNHNEVIDLAGIGPFISGGRETRRIIAEGLPINTMWGYKADGYFQTQDELDTYPTLNNNWGLGDVKYVDRNNDGRITADDMTNIGSTFPKYTVSAAFNLAYKGFDLSLLFQGVGGVDALIGGAIAEMGIWEGFTVTDLENNYWTPDNRNARYPRPLKRDVRNLQGSSRDVWDGSYLRLKNARLLYNLPNNITEKLKMSNLAVYVSGTNLFTISELNKKLFIDPEVRGAQNRTQYYPQTSVVTLGFNVNF
ncbi:MAG: TonB-dependent receptor [Bacteroidetes bacterium]|nr:TonB-dependent receptor [Bacteroidota bacterium]